MVVEKLPTVWFVEIVTVLSQVDRADAFAPRSSSPHTILTVGFCPPVLSRMPDKMAELRSGCIVFIGPRPAGTIVCDTNQFETGRRNIRRVEIFRFSDLQINVFPKQMEFIFIRRF